MENFLIESFAVSTNGRCGPDFNNTTCPSNTCCSQWSWCGSSSDHCVNGKPEYNGEKFTTNSTEDTTNSTENINTTTTPTVNNNSAEDMLKQMEMLQHSMPKADKIVSNNFDGPNDFIPNVVNNFNKINESQKYNYTTKNNEYNTKIKSLEDKISGFRHQLEIESGRDSKLIKSITSVESGQPITVLPVSHDEHVVIVNNECLTTNTVGSYDLDVCNYMDAKQHFNLNPVYHDIDYNVKLSPSSKKIVNSIDETGLSVKYPFMMVKSKTSGNCLGNIDGNIYLKPCQGKPEYRWTPSTSLYQCKPGDKTVKVN